MAKNMSVCVYEDLSKIESFDYHISISCCLTYVLCADESVVYIFHSSEAGLQAII